MAWDFTVGPFKYFVMKILAFLNPNHPPCNETLLIKEIEGLKQTTVNPQKRPASLILSLMVQMRVFLEFGPNLGNFPYCFLSSLRVSLECGSYSRAGLFRGFTLYGLQNLIYFLLILIWIQNWVETERCMGMKLKS